MSSIVAGETPIINLAEDLEDGEIDDDDEEEEEQQQRSTAAGNNNSSHNNNTSANDVQFLGIERKPDKLLAAHDDDVVFLGMSGELQPAACSKSKKPRPLEGKHTSVIAIAMVHFLSSFLCLSLFCPFPLHTQI